MSIRFRAMDENSGWLAYGWTRVSRGCDRCDPSDDAHTWTNSFGKLGDLAKKKTVTRLPKNFVADSLSDKRDEKARMNASDVILHLLMENFARRSRIARSRNTSQSTFTRLEEHDHISRNACALISPRA